MAFGIIKSWQPELGWEEQAKGPGRSKYREKQTEGGRRRTGANQGDRRVRATWWDSVARKSCKSEHSLEQKPNSFKPYRHLRVFIAKPQAGLWIASNSCLALSPHLQDTKSIHRSMNTWKVANSNWSVPRLPVSSHEPLLVNLVQEYVLSTLNQCLLTSAMQGSTLRK